MRDEQVVAVLREDECGYPARTVSGLFTMIERAPSPLFTCASPSCACRNIITVYALYDPQLGYPQKIAVRVDRETNWRRMAFWRYLWSARKLPNCDDGLARGYGRCAASDTAAVNSTTDH